MFNPKITPKELINMQKNKFNAGDRVRILENKTASISNGTLGTYDEIFSSNSKFHLIDLDTGQKLAFLLEEFELVNDVEKMSKLQNELNKEMSKVSGIIDIPPKKQGTKFDNGKPQIDLIPYEAIEEIAKVLTFGCEKYGEANWANGIEMRRLISATYRHLGKFNAGQDMDDESQTLHLANAAANLCFAIWMYKNRPDLDNRWIKGVKPNESN